MRATLHDQLKVNNDAFDASLSILAHNLVVHVFVCACVCVEYTHTLHRNCGRQCFVCEYELYMNVIVIKYRDMQ